VSLLLVLVQRPRAPLLWLDSSRSQNLASLRSLGAKRVHGIGIMLLPTSLETALSRGSDIAV